MYHQFQKHVAPLLDSPKPTLLAISGGVDSIVLLHLFAQTQKPFEIAHAHFGLRHQAADADYHLVKKLAQAHRVPFHSQRFPTAHYATHSRISIQMAARHLRYAWFEEILAQRNITRVATAHHQNDSLETFLRHLTKGTGIVGLTGIKARHHHIIRPLLWATKAQILTYARAHDLTWREDESNQALQYERNYIRHRVIPDLKKLNPSLEKTFSRTRLRLAQVSHFFHEYATHLKSQVWKSTPPTTTIQVATLLPTTYAPTLLYHWLAPFGFSFDSLHKWTTNPPQKGKKLHSPTHTLIAEGKNWLLLPAPPPLSLPTYTIYPTTTSITLPQSRLTITTPTHVQLQQPPSIALLDHQLLHFPLTLRPWQKADRFQPFRMPHTQKISHFLTQQKIPHHLRQSTYVLTTQDQIIWLVGHRIHHHFRVTPSTKKIYQLTLTPQTQPLS